MRADFPIVQYADDTLIIMPACEKELGVLKEILHLYASFTGLKINFYKSSMIPINVSHAEASKLAQIF